MSPLRYHYSKRMKIYAFLSHSAWKKLKDYRKLSGQKIYTWYRFLSIIDAWSYHGSLFMILRTKRKEECLLVSVMLFWDGLPFNRLKWNSRFFFLLVFSTAVIQFMFWRSFELCFLCSGCCILTFLRNKIIVFLKITIFE